MKAWEYLPQDVYSWSTFEKNMVNIVMLLLLLRQWELANYTNFTYQHLVRYTCGDEYKLASIYTRPTCESGARWGLQVKHVLAGTQRPPSPGLFIPSGIPSDRIEGWVWTVCPTRLTYSCLSNHDMRTLAIAATV